MDMLKKTLVIFLYFLLLGADVVLAESNFGSSIVSIGDLNGDGSEDIATSIRCEGTGSGSFKDELFVKYSSGTSALIWGESEVEGLNLLGDCQTDHPLLNVSFLGIDHFMFVGLPYYNFTGGLGRVATDGTTGFNKGHVISDTISWSNKGYKYSKAGTDIANLGDYDGDGWDDVVVSSPFYNNESGVTVGNIIAFSGKSIYGLSKDKVLFKIDGPNVKGITNFGHSIDAGQDVDADGVNDIVVGAPTYQNPRANNEGAVFVFSGKTKRMIRKMVNPDVGTARQFGTEVKFAGDTNLDGRSEILIGSNSTDSATEPSQAEGKVYLYTSFTTLLCEVTATAGSLSSGFGHAIEPSMDVSMPTASPLPPVYGFAVGAPWDSSTGFHRGKVYLFDYQTCSQVSSFAGTMDKGNFGRSIARTTVGHTPTSPDFYVGAPSGVYQKPNGALSNGAVFGVKNDGTILKEFFNNN